MLTLAEIQEEMKKIDNWALESSMISKEFQFGNFKEGIEFVRNVAEIAERHAHHPLILIDYTNVRLTLTTHSERGLTEKDFSLAREIDLLQINPK